MLASQTDTTCNVTQGGVPAAIIFATARMQQQRPRPTRRCARFPLVRFCRRRACTAEAATGATLWRRCCRRRAAAAATLSLLPRPRCRLRRPAAVAVLISLHPRRHRRRRGRPAAVAAVPTWPRRRRGHCAATAFADSIAAWPASSHRRHHLIAAATVPLLSLLGHLLQAASGAALPQSLRRFRCRAAVLAVPPLRSRRRCRRAAASVALPLSSCRRPCARAAGGLRLSSPLSPGACRHHARGGLPPHFLRFPRALHASSSRHAVSWAVRP